MDHCKFDRERLRASGLRPTKQRLAICKILFNRKKTFHFTVEKLKKIVEWFLAILLIITAGSVLFYNA